MPNEQDSTRTLQDRLKENFEAVYKVHHSVEYGFGGNTTIWIAVEEETDTEIRGRKFGPMRDYPGGRVVVRKDNLAGWTVDRHQYDQIPEEVPKPSVEELQRAYQQGRIDEEKLEDGIEEALANE